MKVSKLIEWLQEVDQDKEIEYNDSENKNPVAGKSKPIHGLSMQDGEYVIN
jgi:hypothetical protein